MFTIDGDKASLSHFGRTGDTYESTLKKGKAKFKGSYNGVHNGQPFYKYIKVTVKILDSGDVKVSGSRGRYSHCSGILYKMNTL